MPDREKSLLCHGSGWYKNGTRYGEILRYLWPIKSAAHYHCRLREILILWQTGESGSGLSPAIILGMTERGMVMQKSMECNKKNVNNSKIIAALSYLGVLVAVPFFYG